MLTSHIRLDLNSGLYLSSYLKLLYNPIPHQLLLFLIAAPVLSEQNKDVQEVSFPHSERTPTINTPEVPKSQQISRLRTSTTDGTGTPVTDAEIGTPVMLSSPEEEDKTLYV